jgi:hypothetical protein
VFRRRHPTRRCYTHHSGAILGRLDRHYLPPVLEPYVSAVHTVSSPVGTHHAAALSLSPVLGAPARRQGRRRLPAGLPNIPSVAAALTPWSESAVAFGMTLSADRLVTVWPVIQRGYVLRTRAALHDYHTQQRAQRGVIADAQVAVAAALDSVGLAAAPDLPTTLAAAQAARAHLRHVTSEITRPQIAALRQTWLHGHERPSPALTAMLRAPQAACAIPALVGPDGTRLQAPAAVADRLALHYATISCARPEDAAAQAQVLQALRDELAAGTVTTIPQDKAERAGDPTVTTAEVQAAMRGLPRSSAPGPDGVPYDLWLLGDLLWAPLVARLFSAIAHTNSMPASFHRGTITPILKPDCDPLQPASYRPITLLPTLYRLLTRILATRFDCAMCDAISPAQSAYLSKRLIADNVLFTSLLPHVLTALGIPGATVFLDISKAFDSVIRNFLFQVMHVMGASAGMIQWARLMLRDTLSTVHANGVESRPREWFAGVRQGCPLSPLLYLFVAQALASWLHSHPSLGVVLDARRYVATEHADDTQVHLCSIDPATLSALTTALAVFAAASGQAINLAKSKALLLGCGHALPVPVALSGIPVVPAVTSLGIPHSNCPALPDPALGPHRYHTRSMLRPSDVHEHAPTGADVSAWGGRLTTATRLLGKVRRLPLSAMGRGLAASAYALSTVLYHSEFTDLPDGFADFARQGCRAVCAGVRPALLCNAPADGGFGLLPLTAHVQGRHACLAARLLSHLLPVPAVPEPVGAAGVEQGPVGAAGGGQRPVGAAGVEEGPVGAAGAEQGPVDAPAGRRGQVEAAAERRAATPPWVHLASFLLRRACPSLHPAQTLLLATRSSAADVRQGVLGIPGLPQPRRIAPGALTRMACALQALGPLTSASASTPEALLTQPYPLDAPPPGLSVLHWPQPTTDPSRPPQCVRPTTPVPVRTFTAMLSRSNALDLRVSHAAYVRQAVGATSPAAEAAFCASLSRAWRTPCCNVVKEVLWLVAIDRLPGARFRPWRCPCQEGDHQGPAGRQHTLWTCPVAQSVCAQISAALQHPVTQPALWLLHTPRPDMHHHVWTVVCVCALHAMEFGRGMLWARLLEQPDEPVQNRVQATCNLACNCFWRSLHDFAVSHTQCPFPSPVPAHHPFLYMPDPEGVLHVRMPAP